MISERTVTVLSAVVQERSRHLAAIISALPYRTAWDPERTLGARVQGWSLTELNGSVI